MDSSSLPGSANDGAAVASAASSRYLMSTETSIESLTAEDLVSPARSKAVAPLATPTVAPTAASTSQSAPAPSPSPAPAPAGAHAPVLGGSSTRSVQIPTLKVDDAKVKPILKGDTSRQADGRSHSVEFAPLPSASQTRRSSESDRFGRKPDAKDMWKILQRGIKPCADGSAERISKASAVLASISEFRKALRSKSQDDNPAGRARRGSVKSGMQVLDERIRTAHEAPLKAKGKLKSKRRMSGATGSDRSSQWWTHKSGLDPRAPGKWAGWAVTPATRATVNVVQPSEPTHVGVMSPYSPFRLAWDFSQICFLVYICIALPIRVGFGIDPEGAWIVFESFVDGVFLLDVILNFRTGYITNAGTIIMNPKKIAKTYLKKWFWIDLISSIPDTFLFGSGAAKTLKASRLIKPFRIMRLAKLFRLFKNRSIVDRLEETLLFSKSLIDLAKLLLITGFFAHLGSCTFFFIGTLDQYAGESWVDYSDLNSAPLSQQYTISMYWVVSTLSTVGYGDVVPMTQPERVLSIIIMIFGGGLFGYVIAVMGVIVAKIDAHGQLLTEKMETVKQYLRQRNLDPQLRIRIRRYFQHYYEHRTAFKEAKILDELSSSLRQEVALNLIDDKVIRQEILAGQESEFLTELFLSLKPLRAAAGDVVTEIGEIGREIFFVLEGRLEVITPDNIPLFVLWAGSCFGEAELLHSDRVCRRLVTVRAITDCVMYSCSERSLLKAFQKTPEALRTMRLQTAHMYKKWLAVLRGEITGSHTIGPSRAPDPKKLRPQPSGMLSNLTLTRLKSPSHATAGIFTAQDSHDDDTFLDSDGETVDTNTQRKILTNQGSSRKNIKNSGKSPQDVILQELKRLGKEVRVLSSRAGIASRGGSTRRMSLHDSDSDSDSNDEDDSEFQMEQAYSELLLQVYNKKVAELNCVGSPTSQEGDSPALV